MASADRLIEVFTEAKAKPAGVERDWFLSEACQGQPELKKQVLGLLQAHEGAGDFLKHTQFIPPVTVLTEKPGDKIGHYKLLQKIGEGGCGVVYMAEQEEPVRRRVALKVIKLGMDTKQVVARFEAEGQALAMMDHPNIAKVFDAGATNTGRPYFVMELVRGIKITDYCDQNNLPTEARLKLFTQVCHAIQHAHQKGIIHRDIKPSNILVTINDGVPVPKVIDFGIAKAIEQRLTDKTVFTAFEQFIGTPAYMSPEQAEMTSLDIDTRADVYSLGVLLYELLSGNTPFDSEKLVASGVAEIRRIIREQEPPKPSTRLNTLNDADRSTVAQHRHTDVPKLMHLIRGDLDWIVMKCLEKDRTRRYETANGLAMDLQRHLDDEPVVARPPSTAYRFQKLVRRHKLAFAAASAIAAALVLGVIVSTWQAVRATRAEREQTRLREQAESARSNEARERTKAEANEKKAASEAARSQQVSTFLKDMLNGIGPSVALGRDTTMLREILDKTAERVGHDLTNQPEVEAELRNTIGNVYQALGKYDKAEAMHREALAIRKKLWPHENLAVAESLFNLARATWKAGNLAEAEKLYREALAMQRKLLTDDHLEVALSLNYLARILQIQSQPAEAEKLYYEALAIQRKLLGNEDPNVAVSLKNLTRVLVAEGKLAEAENAIHEALAIQRKLPESPDLADSLDAQAGLLASQGRLAEAETIWREALTMRRKLLGNEHPDVALLLGRLCDNLVAQARFPDAQKLYEESIAAMPQTSGESNPALGQMLHNFAHFLLYQQHKPGAAVEQYLKSLAVRPANSEIVVGTLRELGDALLATGNAKDAEPYLRESVALYRRFHSKDDIWGTAAPTFWRARALQQLQRLPEAEQAYREALVYYSNAGGIGEAGYNSAVQGLVQLLNSENKPAEVESFLKDVLSQERQALGEKHIAVAVTLFELADFLKSQGKLAEAEATIRESLAIASNLRADAANAGMFNSLAWRLVTTENPTSSDAAAAIELAQKAVAATNRKSVGILDTLAVAYAMAGQFTNAVGVQQEAIALLQDEKQIKDYAARLKLYESNSPYRDHAALARRVSALLAQGKFAEADPPARECLARREKQIPDDWLTFNARSMLGGSLLGQKKFLEAEPLLLSGYEGMKQREDKIPAISKSRLKESLQRLVQLYEAMGQPEKAAEWNKKLAEFNRP